MCKLIISKMEFLEINEHHFISPKIHFSSSYNKATWSFHFFFNDLEVWSGTQITLYVSTLVFPRQLCLQTLLYITDRFCWKVNFDFR